VRVDRRDVGGKADLQVRRQHLCDQPERYGTQPKDSETTHRKLSS
jgi:hypothetical protein